MADTPDWRRLGRHVVRRREELGLTQSQAQAAGGPSVATIRNIESASHTSYRGSVLRSLERALEWEPGTIDRILEGADTDVVHGNRIQATVDLDGYEHDLRRIADHPERSEPIKAWARALLDQITQLREAEQREAAERGRRAS